MVDSMPTQQLFDLWKKGLEDSTQAWSRLLTQSPAAPPDPTAFWKPVVEQWVQSWARTIAASPVSPDIAAQWKQFLDHSIEAWSRALGQAMNTDAFAQHLGRYLDQWLVTTAPVKKAADQQIESALQTLNMASRSQLTAVARQIVELEERVERVEDVVGAISRKLDDVLRAVQKRPSSGSHEGASKER
ncbi:MAG: hypothetical protein DMD91_17310 [Candidatus Rokuibacteriota bacterium]|nr:MAG: hypothetical protein DMD91_17310 [Candidatus Rokubacteria bacterium]